MESSLLQGVLMNRYSIILIVINLNVMQDELVIFDSTCIFQYLCFVVMTCLFVYHKTCLCCTWQDMFILFMLVLFYLMNGSILFCRGSYIHRYLYFQYYVWIWGSYVLLSFSCMCLLYSFSNFVLAITYVHWFSFQ